MLVVLYYDISLHNSICILNTLQLYYIEITETVFKNYKLVLRKWALTVKLPNRKRALRYASDASEKTN